MRRYKEVIYGGLAGVSMCLLDAMMHASMHGRLAVETFWQELTATDGTQIFFRTLFIVVAMAFGYSLWSSNRRKAQVEGLQFVISEFHSQIASPAVLIIGYANLLSSRAGTVISADEIKLIRAIQLNAQKISETTNQLPPPGLPLPEVELETRAAFANSVSID